MSPSEAYIRSLTSAKLRPIRVANDDMDADEERELAEYEAQEERDAVRAAEERDADWSEYAMWSESLDRLAETSEAAR